MPFFPNKTCQFFNEEKYLIYNSKYWQIHDIIAELEEGESLTFFEVLPRDFHCLGST